jgi:hypothetical protein
VILDLLGKTMLQRQVNGEKILVVPVKRLPAGVYIIQIKGESVSTFKIIKQ